MAAKTVRSVWGWDPRWIRVEHLDEDGRPLGYTEFEPASESTDGEVFESVPEPACVCKHDRTRLRDFYRRLHQLARALGERLPSWRLGRLARNVDL